MRTRLFIAGALALSVVGVGVFSCTKDKTPRPPEPCDPNKVYFERDIQPMLIASCSMTSGCHSSSSPAEGVVLNTYAGVMEQVKPFNASSSELIEVLTEKDREDQMPPLPYSLLSGKQVDLIRKWIDEGAKNETCFTDSSSCTSTTASYSIDIQPLVASKCANCHGNVQQSGGYNFSTYAGLKTAASSGKLYNAVAQNGQAEPMPVGSKLQVCEIKAIKFWVDAGAPNN